LRKIPGVTAHQLFEALGTSDSVVSRNLALLSDVGVRNGLPLGLVEMKVNPADRREKLLTLTSAGRKLMNQVLTDFARG
jgi:DNA-binding MarR family transcriptional regulator